MVSLVDKLYDSSTPQMQSITYNVLYTGPGPFANPPSFPPPAANLPIAALTPPIAEPLSSLRQTSLFDYHQPLMEDSGNIARTQYPLEQGHTLQERIDMSGHDGTGAHINYEICHPNKDPNKEASVNREWNQHLAAHNIPIPQIDMTTIKKIIDEM